MPFLVPIAIVVGDAVATAAFVVSDVLVPLALGAVGVSGASLAAASAFAFTATTTVIETAALAGISAVLSPHPAVNTTGSPQQFKPDPNAPPPVVMGRYGVGGNLVYETTSGGGNATAAGAKGNEYLTSFVILSALGPVQAFETLRFNDTILTFDPNGQACNGGYIPYDEVQEWNPGYRHQNSDGSYINNNYQDRAWQNLQLGALNAGYFAPPDKLASDNAGLPEWTQAHGFSSFCAAALTLVYDQRYYAGGVPQYQWVLQGIKIYDPRQDSTYPGGSGPQRWAGVGSTAAQIEAARATWTFNQNPAIHALNFALGHFLPDGQTGLGRLYGGIGAGTAGVDIAAFVAAANVADANDWLICGQWTTGDGKWSVLTEMLKAGSATPVIDCGIISCIVDQPLTSLGTVTADDLSGPITLPTGSSFTARLNTIFPRFTSEAHRWQMVTADTPVKAATYVTEDGAVRSRPLDWQYVPAVNQACQLAAYAITNGREIPGITLPGKPKLRNYKVGDCFTLDVDEAGLATTKVMVTKRATDQSTGGVTLTVRTETDAKHAYSLGVSGVAPATPSISGYDPTIVEAPLPDFWATGLLEVSDEATGESRSIIQITGSASDNIYAKFIDIRWRPVAQVAEVWTPTGNGSWSYTQQSAVQGQYPLDLNPGSYDVQIAYTTVSGAYPAADEDWLDLGVETVGGSTASSTASVPETATIGGDGMTVAQALANLAGAESDISQLNGQISDLENDTGNSPAVAAAQAAEQGALDAEGFANQYAGQAQGYANSAETYYGQAATEANDAQGFAQSASLSQTAAGSSATDAGKSATSAASSALSAMVTAAALLPPRFDALGAFFTLDAGNLAGAPIPNADFFLDPNAGGEVFQTTSYTGVASIGTASLTPGRTYQVSAIGALPDAYATFEYVGLFVFDVTGNFIGFFYLQSGQFPAGSYGPVVGQVSTEGIRANATFAQAAQVRPGILLNSSSSGGATAFTTYLSELRLADITESAASAASASASYTSEQSASASENGAGVYSGEAQSAYTLAFAAQNAAGQSAASAAGSYSDAEGEAGDASGSAQAAMGYSLAAQGYQGQAQGYAGDAHGSAVDANGSAVSAAESAALVANYNPGSNLVINPSFNQGSAGWYLFNGTGTGGDPGIGSYALNLTSNGDMGVPGRVCASQPKVACSAGDQFAMQAVLYSGGVGASTTFLRALVHFYNSAGQDIGEDGPQTNVASSWTRHVRDTSNGAPITAPAGAVAYAIVLDMASSSGDLIGTGDNVGWTKVKLEPGATCTPYTDDQVGAAITTQAVVAANDNAATAYSLTELQATVDDPSTGLAAAHASVSTNEAAIALLNGQVSGMLKFTVNAGGQTVGLELLATDGGSTPLSAVRITAEELLFTTPGGDLIFGVDGETGYTFLQNLLVNGNAIFAGTVGTTQLAPGCVSSLSYGLSNAQTSIYVSGSAPTYTPPTGGSGGGNSGGPGRSGGVQP